MTFADSLPISDFGDRVAESYMVTSETALPPALVAKPLRRSWGGISCCTSRPQIVTREIARQSGDVAASERYDVRA